MQSENLIFSNRNHQSDEKSGELSTRERERVGAAD